MALAALGLINQQFVSKILFTNFSIIIYKVVLY